MSIKEINSTTRGTVGWLHEVECVDNQSVLIFQLPRNTNMIGKEYISHAQGVLKESLPKNRNALIIGADINVYELFGADAVILKLKGLI